MKRLIMLFATLATASAGLVAIPASAQAATTACTASQAQYCLGPSEIALSTSGPYCTPFSDGLEWQPYTDANGVGQLWTYSNGSNPCIQVNYTPVNTSANCYFSFYVPDNGYANANIVFGWWDSRGKHLATTVNEATSPSTGWVELNMGPDGFAGGASNVTRISFQDNNGQSPGSTYIGWATSDAYGIQQTC